MNLLAELRRRSVFRVAAAYLISGWAVMQVVGVVANASGLPDWADSLALVLLMVGLPIALIVAWAFEMTPDGVKQTDSSDDVTVVRPFSVTDGVLLAGLAIVIGFIGWQQLAAPAPQVVTVLAPIEAPIETMTEDTTEQGPEAASIAVLAFADLSPEGDQEYFSDGISEELLNVLVRVEGLRVASRTSAFQFKGRDVGIPYIAAELNVRHVLEGSVRTSGETIRITAQLIDSATDEHLWSDTYDRTLTASNIFEIQDDIATAIVAALSTTLEGVLGDVVIEVEARTENLTAYELYLQARPLFLAREGLDVVDGYLRQAVTLDPQFSEAWEMRGAIHMLARDYGFIDATEEALHQLALDYSRRALAIDPESSLAIAVITNVENRLVEVPDAASLRREVEGFTRALEIDPRNTSALNWRGLAYAALAFFDLAIEDFASCIALEPLYQPCHGNLVFQHTTNGNDEAAFDIYIAAANSGIGPISFPLPMLARLGKREMFLVAAAEEYGPYAPWADNDELYEIFRNPEGDWDHLMEAITAFEIPLCDARDQNCVDIIIGNYDRYDPEWGYPQDRILAGFRRSETFQRILVANGLPDYWRTYGFPPQCRERDDGWIECD